MDENDEEVDDDDDDDDDDDNDDEQEEEEEMEEEKEEEEEEEEEEKGSEVGNEEEEEEEEEETSYCEEEFYNEHLLNQNANLFHLSEEEIAEDLSIFSHSNSNNKSSFARRKFNNYCKLLDMNGVDNLIFDYLMKEGHTDALLAFQEERKISENSIATAATAATSDGDNKDGDTESSSYYKIQHRNTIINSILKGDIEKAISCLNELDSTILEKK